MFRNLGQGGFEDVTAASGDAAAAHSSRGAAFGDVDNDGDIDVLVMNMNEPPSLLRNDYRGGHGWIEIELQGTRSNRSAIGAIVVVSAGGRTQARTVAQPIQLLLARRLPPPLRARRQTDGRSDRGAMAGGGHGRPDQRQRDNASWW